MLERSARITKCENNVQNFFFSIEAGPSNRLHPKCPGLRNTGLPVLYLGLVEALICDVEDLVQDGVDVRVLGPLAPLGCLVAAQPRVALVVAVLPQRMHHSPPATHIKF